MQRGLRPILLLNKLDKLMALEPALDRCHERLNATLERLNDLPIEMGDPDNPTPSQI